MKRVANLSTYLSSYNLSKECFMEEIDKDREFYDKYIEWHKDDSKTILSPKALERLGKVFNDEEPKMTVTVDGEVQKEISLAPEKEAEDEQMDISKFMDNPVVAGGGIPTSERVSKTKSEIKAKPKKKSKLNITKQFIQENGSPVEVCDARGLRQFLLGSGIRKVEEVALMGDEEVLEAIGKEYFFIASKDRFLVFKKSVLLENLADIYVVERNNG